MNFWQNCKAWVWKNSPYILTGAGILGGIGATVLACKATTKLPEVTAENEARLDLIQCYEEAAAEEKTEDGVVGYSEKDHKKNVLNARIAGLWAYAKLYGPAILTGAASVACILGGTGILNKRLGVSIAACASIERAFKEYRKRVIDAEGKDADDRYFYGIEKKTIEVPELDENGEEKKDKNGKVKTKKVEVSFIPTEGEWTKLGYSPYAKMFDDFNSCEFERGDQYHNLAFLDLQEKEACKELERKGYLLLNDVYEMLDFEKTPEGQVVGWIYDPEKKIFPDHEGDNKVDFMITHVRKNPEAEEQRKDFLLGRCDAVIVDFNVDGVIIDKIGTMERRFRAPWRYRV